MEKLKEEMGDDSGTNPRGFGLNAKSKKTKKKVILWEQIINTLT